MEPILLENLINNSDDIIVAYELTDTDHSVFLTIFIFFTDHVETIFLSYNYSDIEHRYYEVFDIESIDIVKALNEYNKEPPTLQHRDVDIFSIENELINRKCPKSYIYRKLDYSIKSLKHEIYIDLLHYALLLSQTQLLDNNIDSESIVEKLKSFLDERNQIANIKDLQKSTEIEEDKIWSWLDEKYFPEYYEDEEEYNEDGYNEYGYNEDEFNEYGYNEDGYNEDEYN